MFLTLLKTKSSSKKASGRTDDYLKWVSFRVIYDRDKLISDKLSAYLQATSPMIGLQSNDSYQPTVSL